MIKLQEMSVRKLSNQVWFGLSPHFQYCLFPRHLHNALGKFQGQCNIIFKRRIMDVKQFSDLFLTAGRAELLRPENCTFYTVFDGSIHTVKFWRPYRRFYRECLPSWYLFGKIFRCTFSFRF